MTGMVENQKIYISRLMMEVLGNKLERDVSAICNTCILWDDCKPLPLFEDGKFIGVRSDI
jgi:hypothetical protein